ncbi:MAG: lysylphosphatidylglycerol synthase domain-containing protein [Phycisphaerales bacterium]
MSEAGGGGRRRIGAIVQVVGFAGALVLLAWCVSKALSPENREQLSKLSDASAGQVIGLLGLSVATVTINGLIFWIVVRPVKRIPVADVIGANALATFLSYLPFKLSVVARFVVHNRRDGVPVLTIGAWLAACGVMFVATLGPVLAVSLWRRGIDAWWWSGSVVGVVACAGAVLVVARAFRGDEGLARLHRVTDPMKIGLVNRALRTERFGQLHDGFGMLSCPWAVFGAAGLRVLDVSVVSARFLIAAAVLGVDLSWQDAGLMGATFFIIGVLSPVGSLGTREGGTLALASAVGIAAAHAEGDAGGVLAVVILFVSGTESVVLIAGAGFAVAWLRADRLLRGRVKGDRP